MESSPCSNTTRKTHAVVIVLGDSGRSPRMQFHAQSLAGMDEVHRVSLIGYSGEVCNAAITSNDKIRDCRLNPSSTFHCIEFLRGYSSLLHAVLKGLLYKPTHVLVRISYYLEFLMAQLSDTNFCVSAAMRKWLLSHYGIDSTVFYDRPPKSVFQKFRTEIKTHCDRRSSSSSGSSSDGDGDGVKADSDSYCCVRLADRHELLRRLDFTDTALFPSFRTDTDTDTDTDMTEVTLQTYRHRTTGALHLRPDRAVLLLSSTSWSPDEDFTLLTKALINLDKSIAKRRGSESPRKKQLPLSSSSSSSSSSSGPHPPSRVSNVPTRVVVVITGKGPMKEQFMADWKRSQEAGSASRLTYISLQTVWLEIADYPLLVGCADMGICLHTSSSGVDLPMKVLDMFGSAVPVCAVSFPALPELVQNGGNGIIFRTSSELSAHLFRLFCDFPRDLNSLKDLKEMKRKTLEIGCWEDNWAAIVRPVVLRSLQGEGEGGAAAAGVSARTESLLRGSVVVLVLAVALLCGLCYGRGS